MPITESRSAPSLWFDFKSLTKQKQEEFVASMIAAAINPVLPEDQQHLKAYPDNPAKHTLSEE